MSTITTRAARAAALLALCTTLFATACDDGPNKPQTPGGDVTPGAGGGGSSLTPDGKVDESKPLTVAEVEPSFREVGAIGVAPRELTIDFARAVRNSEELEGVGTEGLSSGKSVLKIEPSIAGELVFTSPTTLSFRARDGFAPETSYKVRLEKLETKAGLFEPPGDTAWSYAFQTPKFELLRTQVGAVEAGRKEVDVELVFSASVDAGPRLKDFTRFQLDGRTISEVRFATGTEPHVVKATLRNVVIDPGKGATIETELLAGVKARGRKNAAAPSNQRTVVPGGQLWRVMKLHRREAPSGHYLEVICDDDGSGGERWFWDDESHDDYRVSRRCVLDDASAERLIEIQPKVKLSVSPSNGGFRILGDFARGAYTVRIQAGARTIDGGVLASAYEAKVSVPARSPQVRFASEGRYLPRKAWKALPVTHLNVDGAELVVRQVPPQNLVFWMSDDESERASERTADVILKTKLALKSAPDQQATTWVDVQSMLAVPPKGLLELTVQQGATNDVARVLVTDLSLVAKRGGVTPERPWGEEVMVWAFGAEDLVAKSGVEVKLLKKSGQVVGTCRTSGEQGCRISIPKPEVDPSAPFALLAQQGDDLTYLKFKDLEVEIGEARVDGEPFTSARPHRAVFWSDRGVYRPGETVHLAAVLRDREHVAPKAGLPVQLLVRDARGRELRKTTQPTNDAGLVTIDVPTGSFATTGRWDVEAKVADKIVGSYGFMVEEFVPERMKVEASAVRPGVVLGEQVELAISAKYLFGGIPADHAVELTCTLEPTDFKPKENAQLHYGVWTGEKTPRALPLGQASGTLDAEGRTTLACPSPKEGAPIFAGAARVVGKAAVFEAGSGRSTVGDASALVHPERFYLGLDSGAKVAEQGKALTVKGLVVDPDGKPFGGVGEVELEFVRLEEEYGWWWDDDEGSGSTRRHLRPVVEARQKVATAAGVFTASFTPQQDSNRFLVRAKAGKARTDLPLDGKGRWYWYEPSEARADVTPKPTKPTWLDVKLPKEGKVGEAISVTVRAPYGGRILFTAETDKVLESEWKTVQAGEQTWSFSAKSFAPNVYVSAFLVKDPKAESPGAFVPDRAFGVASVKLLPQAWTQEVSLELPTEIRSNADLTVTVKAPGAEAGSVVTIAAVDEGILQLTKFQTPDPLAALMTRRALGVQTFETVGWTLLLPPGSPAGATGGGDDGDGGGRVQPVKPVALWSGVVSIGADGTAKATFPVPTYRGELRVMAIVAGPKKLGRAQAAVKVRDPLTLLVTLPRFLTQGDRFEIPVFVTNLSGADVKTTVNLTAEAMAVPGLDEGAKEASPLEIAGAKEKALQVTKDGAGTVVFRGVAKKSVGAARVRVFVKGGGHESYAEAEIPFAPAAPRSRKVQKLELVSSETELKPQLSGWVPTTERTTFWVTNNPYGEVFDHLKFLVHYPHGCIEQTSSSTWPLLALAPLVGSSDPELAASGKIETYARAGIDRILSMQTPSGGFAYWPGGTEPYDWATAYATHLLLDAQKLGYPVPKERIEDALKYLETIAEKPPQYAWRGDHEAYAQFVLALGGKARKGRVAELLAGMSKEPRGIEAERQYLLMAALWLAGDRRHEAALKKPDVSAVLEDRDRNGWSYYSDRRRRGLMLSIFGDLFGPDVAGEHLANVVAESLRARPSWYYTTQELSWSIVGLGKRVKGNVSKFGKPTLLIDGRTMKPVPPLAGATVGSDVTWAIARASEGKSVSLRLEGKPEGKLWLIASSDGVRENEPVRVGGEGGLSVTRTYRTAGGQELDPKDGGLKLGDLVYVEVTMRNSSNEQIGNLALVDRLAAGFEIENPRLGRGATEGFLDAESVWAVDHLEVRDDRIEAFGTIPKNSERKLVYAVRAVTAGSFTAPPIELEAMYDPRVWAREAGGPVLIAGPWERFVD